MSPRPQTRVIEHLRLLNKLDVDARRRLLDRLSTEPLSLYPFTRVSDAVREINHADALTAEEAHGLGGALGSIAFTLVSSAEPPADVLKKLVESFAVVLPPTEVEVVHTFLTRYIAAGDLLNSFKATSLYEDGENVVLNSRIIVDLRPVFDTTDSTSVPASALLYRLRMTYRVPNGNESRTLVLTLHEQELRELADAIKRAGDKAGTLKVRLENGALGKILEDRT